jgi:hypothetical protein
MESKIPDGFSTFFEKLISAHLPAIRGIETLLIGLVYEGRVLPIAFFMFYEASDS